MAIIFFFNSYSFLICIGWVGRIRDTMDELFFLFYAIYLFLNFTQFLLILLYYILLRLKLLVQLLQLSCQALVCLLGLPQLLFQLIYLLAQLIFPAPRLLHFSQGLKALLDGHTDLIAQGLYSLCLLAVLGYANWKRIIAYLQLLCRSPLVLHCQLQLVPLS